EFDLSSSKLQSDAVLKKERRIVLIILLVTMGLWMTSSIHHLGVSAVAAIPIVFLTMTGIL
ncbi:MAG TPA: hypothetical protein DIC22_05205, partial [Chitinophagaceae bacterium]|nr:hypothetical protein [Chitinophagaceae bacterium]